MSEQQKQADFLKALLASADRPEHRDLADRLQAAGRDEQCMKRACRLVVIITLLALSVLGYLTLLKVPGEAEKLTQTALRFCQALALGSAMCLGVFLGLLCWHRALINRLLGECRKLITAGIHPQPQQARSESCTVVVHEGDTAVYHLRTQAQTRPGAEIITLPKAS